MNLRSALVLAFTTVSAVAQVSVTLTGRIERAPTGACSSAATHRITCTNVLLQSTAVSLAQFEGRFVDLSGTSIGTTGCPEIDVATAVAAPNATSVLALGSYRINTNIIFSTTAPIGAIVGYLFAHEPGFLPLANFGSLMLSPTDGLMYWSEDISIGVALRTVRIPDDPVLVGQICRFQTVMIAVAPQFEVKLLNPGCFTFQPR